MPEIFSGGVPKTGTKANGQNSSSSNAPSFISDIKSGATDLAQDIYSGVGEFAENLASNFRSKKLLNLVLMMLEQPFGDMAI